VENLVDNTVHVCHSACIDPEVKRSNVKVMWLLYEVKGQGHVLIICDVGVVMHISKSA